MRCAGIVRMFECEYVRQYGSVYMHAYISMFVCASMGLIHHHEHTHAQCASHIPHAAVN